MSRQTLKTYPKSVWTKAKTPKWAKKPNKTNFSLIGWQNNEIRLQTLNSTRNWQKNAEITKFSDFWAICVRKRIFLEFSKFPLFGPRFPLFSRCFPAVRAQFPLFSRCFAIFPLFSVHFGVFKVLRSKRTKKQNFQEFCPKQWFCGQNAQKNKIFKNFVQNSGFVAKTHKTNRIFRFLPKPGQNRQEKPIFPKSCPKQVKTDKKTKFSEILLWKG